MLAQAQDPYRPLLDFPKRAENLGHVGRGDARGQEMAREPH